MVPIEFKITNKSQYPFKIDIGSVKLLGSNKVEVGQLSVEEAINRQQYSIGKSIITGFPVLSQIKAGTANGKISKYCESTLLTDSELLPGDSRTGFLYYNCPDRPKTIGGWQLNFTCIQNGYQANDIEYVFGEGPKVVIRIIENKRNVASTNTESLEDKLLNLKILMDKNLITEDEYEKKRALLIEKY